MNAALKPTQADLQIQRCLAEARSFYVIAGAGSGKTESLVTALLRIRESHGKQLRRDGQRIACVTYTNRAVEVISARLAWDELYTVGTIHGFMWDQIARFADEIRATLKDFVIPDRIAKAKEKDNGGTSKEATQARERITKLEGDLTILATVPEFKRVDSEFSDYPKGEIGHDDVIALASKMIETFPLLCKVIGQRFPYILVDEAQDTHPTVVSALNRICEGPSLPMVGYFGDPMQQIFEKSIGEFHGPANSLRIPKEENFRSSLAVIELLNSFRADIQQKAGGDNDALPGSVVIRLIQSEEPKGKRGRYDEEQLLRASAKLDQALIDWKWSERSDSKQLFLARQMIARRLGFKELNKLFTGDYASSRAKDDYEKGNHFLLKPFRDCLCQLVTAWRAKDFDTLLRTLRRCSPAFDPLGSNSKRPLGEMMARASSLIEGLVAKWDGGTVGDILRICAEANLTETSPRLLEHLSREPNKEEYDEAKHRDRKGEWLADRFFLMKIEEIVRYSDFTRENTVFSTQHGVKGEQYENVLAVFDDIGADWSNYSFTKTLTPISTGKEAKDTQQSRTTRLAYVCFSRAIKDLRIAMFTPNPAGAKDELVKKGLFKADQVEIV